MCLCDHNHKTTVKAERGKYMLYVYNEVRKKQDELWANAHLWYPGINVQGVSDGSKNASHNMAYLYESCDQISDFCQKYLGTDGRTDRGKTVYPSSGGAGV